MTSGAAGRGRATSLGHSALTGRVIVAGPGAREPAPPAERDLRPLHYILLSAIALLIAFRLYTGQVLEDALITFRFAENLVAGRGFAFNPGEAVLATTTPLMTLLLAGLGLVFGAGQIPLLAVTLSIAAAVAAGAVLFRTLEELELPPHISLPILAFYFLYPGTLWASTGGMETALVVLAMVAGWSTAVRRAYAISGAWCAVLVLLRIDGAVWALLTGLFILRRDPRGALRAAGAGLAVLAPWLIFSLAHFGQVLPNSLLAKQATAPAYGLLDLTTLLERGAWMARYLGAVSPFGSLPGLALYGLGVAAVWRRYRPELRLPALFPLVFALALHLGHAPRFAWYLTPVAWCSIAVGTIGLAEIVRWIARGRDLNEVALTWAAMAVLVLGFVRLDAKAFEFHRANQRNETGLRRQVGEWLREHVPAGDSVAMEAIGYQGYYSHRRIIDLAGVVSPEVVAIRRESGSNAEGFHRVLVELQPEYIVLRSYVVDENRHLDGGSLFETDRQQADFERWYEEAARFDAPLPDLWGELGHVTVFRRVL